MKTTRYMSVYNWGPDPYSVDGMVTGPQTYTDLNDLFSVEPEAIAYVEVTVNHVSKAEFEGQAQCGAW